MAKEGHAHYWVFIRAETRDFPISSEFGVATRKATVYVLYCRRCAEVKTVEG